MTNIKGYDHYMKGYDQYINGYDKCKKAIKNILPAMTNI